MSDESTPSITRNALAAYIAASLATGGVTGTIASNLGADREVNLAESDRTRLDKLTIELATYKADANADAKMMLSRVQRLEDRVDDLEDENR